MTMRLMILAVSMQFCLCSWLLHLEVVYSVVQSLPWCFPSTFLLVVRVDLVKDLDSRLGWRLDLSQTHLTFTFMWTSSSREMVLLPSECTVNYNSSLLHVRNSTTVFIFSGVGLWAYICLVKLYPPSCITHHVTWARYYQGSEKPGFFKKKPNPGGFFGFWVLMGFFRTSSAEWCQIYMEGEND